MRSGMIRHRVVRSLSETEKKLLGRDVNSVPLPIVQFNPNDSTFVVAIIDSRAEVAGLLADRYVSEFFRHSNGSYGVDPEEAKQMLRAAQARIIQEIKAAKTALETHRQSHADEAAAELDVLRTFDILPFRRLESETATLNRFQLFFRRAH